MSVSQKARKRVSVIEINKKGFDASRSFPAEEQSSDVPTGPKIGCRHVQACLLNLALIFGIGMRTNFSVAIVAMTDSKASSNPDVPTYDWNNTNVMLSSFYWTYISLQVLAGYLGKTYGPKYFLLVSFFLNSCACAAIPMAAATMGSTGVILCRMMQGITQGFLYPSVQVMMGTWVPDQERSTINAFVSAGVNLGSIYASILTGYISASWLGWPFSFYILASMGFLWCIIWAFFGQNTPASHPSITNEERRYIQQSLKQEEDIQLPIPWKKILTCPPIYTLLIAYIANIWGYATLMTETPTYLSKIMNFDVKQNALISSLPIALGMISGLIIGPLSDWLITRKYLSTLTTRRYFHIVGCYGQALCLIWLSVLRKDQGYMSIAALGLGNVLTAGVLVGSNVNHLDLSPRFSGIIFGILNATGQAASTVAPLFAQYIVTDQGNVAQWRVLYLTAVGFFILGGTVFFLFASTTRQPWDGPENKELEERRKKISVTSFTMV